MSRIEIKKLLLEDAAFYDAQMNEIKLNQYAESLSDISPTALTFAIKFYRNQPGRRQMPMPADYIQAIPDGHPTAQEAWAMMPKDEYKSVVWSEEMRIAFGSCASLLETSQQSAWFAFKENYERLVQDARASRKRPKWSISPGMDKSGRDTAVVEAVQKGRITLEIAVKMNPELEYNPTFEQLFLEYGGTQTQQIESQKNRERVHALIGSIGKSLENI